MTPVYLGDDAPAPPPPDGFGGLLLSFWFDSTVELIAGGRVVQDHPNYALWIAAPVLYIDGAPVSASWSRWWYPLPPGRYPIDVTQPLPAKASVDIAPGTAVALAYRADLRIRRDVGETTILGRTGTATLLPG